MVKITTNEFYNLVIGKKIDADGKYNNQCVDLFIYYCDKKNIPYANTVTGWAGGLWTHRKEHYKKYFDLVTKFSDLKTGDWIFTTKPEHVAMWYNGKMLGQNQDGKLSAVDLRPFVGQFLGAYRLKTNKSSGVINTTLQEAYKRIAEEIKKGTYGNGHENRMKKIYEEIRKEVNKK